MRHVAGGLAVVTLLLCASRASAHAFLKTATPAVGASVQEAPAQVVIDFTEGVEPGFSTITVQDAGGARVNTGAVHLAGGQAHLAIGLKPLPPGAYTVVWHVTSTDTHKTEGRYSFTVGR
jgi:methionine-rich copper-binding protein CopC